LIHLSVDTKDINILPINEYYLKHRVEKARSRQILNHVYIYISTFRQKKEIQNSHIPIVAQICCFEI